MFAFHLLDDAITQGEYISRGYDLIQGVQLSYTRTGVPCAGAVSCANNPACLWSWLVSAVHTTLMKEVERVQCQHYIIACFLHHCFYICSLQELSSYSKDALSLVSSKQQFAMHNDIFQTKMYYLIRQPPKLMTYFPTQKVVLQGEPDLCRNLFQFNLLTWI